MSNTCSGTTRTGAACRNPVAESGGNCGRCKGPASPSGSGGRADVLDVDEGHPAFTWSEEELRADFDAFEAADGPEGRLRVWEDETHRLSAIAASFIADEVYSDCLYVDLIGDDDGSGWELTEVHCRDIFGGALGTISDDGSEGQMVSASTWKTLQHLGDQCHQLGQRQWGANG